MKKEILKMIIKEIFKDVDNWAQPYCDLDLFEVYMEDFLHHSEAEILECFYELGFATCITVSPDYTPTQLKEVTKKFMEENY